MLSVVQKQISLLFIFVGINFFCGLSIVHIIIPTRCELISEFNQTRQQDFRF